MITAAPVVIYDYGLFDAGATSRSLQLWPDREDILYFIINDRYRKAKVFSSVVSPLRPPVNLDNQYCPL